MEVFIKIFLVVFLAELGDKTQLATLGFAATEPVSPWVVFFSSSLALVLSAGIGVLFGHFLSGLGWERYIRIAGGCLFLGIGAWTLLKEFLG